MTQQHIHPGLRVEDVSFAYADEAPVLHNVGFAAMAGRLTLLTGESGSGKTTLMGILSGIIPTTGGGDAFWGERQITNLDNKALHAWRTITGRVYQTPAFLNGLSVRRNMGLLSLLNKQPIDPEYADTVCHQLGIRDDWLDRSPSSLSGGQAQRVAIAQAVLHKPEVLFADEPTAALDSENTQRVHELLRGLAGTGLTVIMSSHDVSARSYADKVVELRDGAVVRPFDN